MDAIEAAEQVADCRPGLWRKGGAVEGCERRHMHARFFPGCRVVLIVAEPYVSPVCDLLCCLA